MNFLLKLFCFLSLPLYLLDQATKWWTVKHFPEPESPNAFEIPVIENVFHWIRVHNQGVAFGLGNGTSWAPIVFLCVPLAALGVIFVLWKRNYFVPKVSQIALALIVSGILGNLTDRLLQGFHLSSVAGGSFWEKLAAGYVVDFIGVKLPFYEMLVPSSRGWWPAFNVADSCVCVAATLLFISGLVEDFSKKKKAQS